MRSEDDKERRKKALNILFNYSSDDMDSAVNSSNNARESLSLIFGSNSFVSFVRGTDCSYKDGMNAVAHSTPVNSKSIRAPYLGSPYLESLNLAESDFFDSETGKQMILKDQTSHERFSMQATDCTGCSSWTPCSRKNISSMPIDLSGFKQKESVSVGEFIGRFSETTSFSDIHKKRNIFASTPKEKKRSLSMSFLLDIDSRDFSSASTSNLDNRRNESLSTIGTPTSIKPLDFSVPRCIENNHHSEDFHYYIDRATHKKIDRLKKEERIRLGLDERTSFDSLETDVTLTKNSGASGSNETTFVLPNGSSALTSDSVSKSCNDQWFLDPQAVLLDIAKGNRVRLINNTPKILKFKTSLDSRIINICPLSGTVPAMGQIGLRLLITTYAKKKNENFESDIKVIIGKNEKSIHVKFVKSGKSKPTKERSYIFY